MATASEDRAEAGATGGGGPAEETRTAAAGLMTLGKASYNASVSVTRYEGSDQVKVGKFCSIAPGFSAILCGGHRTDWVTTFPFGHVHKGRYPHHGRGHPAGRGGIRIGNDVWVGTHVTVMDGVTIGDGAVVAAYSHVVKDVPAYSIVGGNPARVIRMRFAPAVIDSLVRIRWWDWEDARIASEVATLCSDRLEEFCAKHDPSFRPSGS